MKSKEKLLKEFEEIEVYLDRNGVCRLLQRFPKYTDTADLVNVKVKAFLPPRILDQARQEGLRAKREIPHTTEEGWCCACPYDKILLKERIKKARQESREELLKEIEDLNIDEMFAKQIREKIINLIKKYN
jgi:hypothetical protein